MPVKFSMEAHFPHIPKVISSPFHPPFFQELPDSRRVSGRRYIHCVLAIAAGAYLCGARSYLAMSEWAERLTQIARQGLRCRSERNFYRVPSVSIIREVLMRVNRGHLRRALDRWNAQFVPSDPSLILLARELCMDDVDRLPGGRGQPCGPASPGR